MTDDDQAVQFKRLKNFCPWDIRSDFAVCSAIADLGMLSLLDGEVYRADSPEVVSIVDAVKNSDDYRKLFSVKISESPMKAIALIFDLIGVKSDSNRVRIGGGKKCWQYSYYALNDERSDVLAECISQRMGERLLTQEGERYEAPKDSDFDIDILGIAGVPNIKQWMGESDISNIEILWKAASQSLAECGSEDSQIAVKEVVIRLWNINRIAFDKRMDDLMSEGF